MVQIVPTFEGPSRDHTFSQNQARGNKYLDLKEIIAFHRNINQHIKCELTIYVICPILMPRNELLSNLFYARDN